MRSVSELSPVRLIFLIALVLGPLWAWRGWTSSALLERNAQPSRRLLVYQPSPEDYNRAFLVGAGMTIAGTGIFLSGAAAALFGYRGARWILLRSSILLIALLTVNFISLDLPEMGLPAIDRRLIPYLTFAASRLAQYLAVIAFPASAIVVMRGAIREPNLAFAPVAGLPAEVVGSQSPAKARPIDYHFAKPWEVAAPTPCGELQVALVVVAAILAITHILSDGYYLFAHLDELQVGIGRPAIVFGFRVSYRLLWLDIAIRFAAWPAVLAGALLAWNNLPSVRWLMAVGLAIVGVEQFINICSLAWTPYPPGMLVAAKVVTQAASLLAFAVMGIVLATSPASRPIT